MIVDLLIHIMFQVLLSIILFWYVVVPVTKKSVDETINELIDTNIKLDKPLIEQESLVVYKEYLLDYLSKKDQYAFEQNTQVLKTTFIIIISTIFICFTLMFLFACNQNPLPIIYELVLVYAIVLIVQILFILFVFKNFTPITYNQIIDFITVSLNQECLKK